MITIPTESLLKRARTKRVRLAPSYEPLNCIVLAVDTAERSGWALYVRGKLVNWGEVDMLRPERSSDRCGPSGWDADRVCLHALVECCHDNPLPVVLVFERPFRGNFQGQYVGSWKAAFMREGGSKGRMLGVLTSTWRARVTGQARANRDTARDGEQRRAKREIASLDGSDWTKVEVGGDAAAAIGIGLWAIRAGEVAKLLPKPRKPKAPKPERPRCLSTPKPRKKAQPTEVSP